MSTEVVSNQGIRPRSEMLLAQNDFLTERHFGVQFLPLYPDDRPQNDGDRVMTLLTLATNLARDM